MEISKAELIQLQSKEMPQFEVHKGHVHDSLNINLQNKAKDDIIDITMYDDHIQSVAFTVYDKPHDHSKCGIKNNKPR